jgi:hypothetical protein
LVTYAGNTYRCLQAHTAIVSWEPPNAPALWLLLDTSAPTLTPTPTATAPLATETATPTSSATTGTPTVTPSATPSSTWPRHVFAPYVDVSLWPTFALSQTATTTGQKYYTLAFMISDGTCKVTWGGNIALSQDFLYNDIQALRSQGGDVIGALGGAAGVELGQACATVASLQAQYQVAIDTYNFTQLDFDIEGAALADLTANTRRNQAIAGLQAAASAAGKVLKISYTLPVLPTGLMADGVNLLQDAIDNGVAVDVVNLMTMDFGDSFPPDKMGDNAIQAATSVFGQLQSLYPNKTDAQRWAMIGITPMIGLNDVVPEVFTLSDAQQVLTLAQQKHVARLAMWSASRDQACPGAPVISATCSGVSQQPWDFTNLFKPYTTP